MGVSGAGKSIVATRLAAALDYPFVDGDDLHGEANLAKMRRGEPLTDEDREPWLRRVVEWLRERPGGGVVACSALRRAYRDVLREAGPDVVHLHLDVPAATLAARMAQRDHFMPTVLLESQLETLEQLGADEAGATIAADAPLDDVVARCLAALDVLGARPSTSV
jgi:gluconokinase